MTNSLTTTLKYMFIQSISKHLLSLFQALTLKLGSMMKPANNLALKHIVKQRKSQGVECTESTRIGHVKWTASFLTFCSPALGNMCFDRYGKGWLKSLNSHLGWHVWSTWTYSAWRVQNSFNLPLCTEGYGNKNKIVPLSIEIFLNFFRN